MAGWLVCLTGDGQGRSYEVRDGNNYVGESDWMDISIQGDPDALRDRPVVITYDRRDRAFYCGLTGGAEVVRLNGKPLTGTAPLKAGDRLELSRTELLFVPLCGPDFDWGPKVSE